MFFVDNSILQSLCGKTYETYANLNYLKIVILIYILTFISVKSKKIKIFFLTKEFLI